MKVVKAQMTLTIPCSQLDHIDSARELSGVSRSAFLRQLIQLDQIKGVSPTQCILWQKEAIKKRDIELADRKLRFSLILRTLRRRSRKRLERNRVIDGLRKEIATLRARYT